MREFPLSATAKRVELLCQLKATDVVVLRNLSSLCKSNSRGGGHLVLICTGVCL